MIPFPERIAPPSWAFLSAMERSERNANATRARLDRDRAFALARNRYGLEVSAAKLPGYEDQNFLLEDAAGTRHVLKITSPGQEEQELVFENAALAHLEARGFPTPRVIADRTGRRLSALAGGWVRMLSWIGGRPLAEQESPPGELFTALGRLLGELDRAFADFDHPCPPRRLSWDLKRAGEAQALLDCHLDPGRRRRIERTLSHFAAEVREQLDAVPQGVIHNDGNDWNVIVEARDPTRIAGLIDFGDTVRTALVCEPAIAMAYAMLARPDPLQTALQLLAGYHRARPLSEREVSLLLDLIETRLCVSVTISAHERVRQPDNEYLGITAPKAWKLLEWIDAQDRQALVRSFEKTCAEATA